MSPRVIITIVQLNYITMLARNIIFDSKTNKYVYWSPEHHTFLPAPDSDSKKPDDEKKKDEKKDKVKTAKRIAKDMEKWAKTLNQKAKGQPIASPAAAAPSASTTA